MKDFLHFLWLMIIYELHIHTGYVALLHSCMNSWTVNSMVKKEKEKKLKPHIFFLEITR